MDTMLQFGGFDAEGVIYFKKNEEIVYNVFEVALQAMVGAEVDIPYRRGYLGLQPRYYDINKLPDPRYGNSERAALGWLVENSEPGPGNSLCWPYNFDIEFRGQTVKQPWLSAFGQGYAVLAFLLWYKHTREPKYLESAVKGARVLGISQSHGGVAYMLPGGGWFFEELPLPASTHILNAHLIAIVALLEVVAESGDDFLSDTLEKGLRGIEGVIGEYDTGSWSCYDRPVFKQLFLRLSPKSDKAISYVGQISLFSGERELGSVDAASDASFSRGDWQISGIDWSDVRQMERPAFKGRRLLYGPGIHLEPAPTGTRQNTYLLIKTSIPDDPISLRFDVFADGDLTLDIEHRDLGDCRLSFCLTHESHRIQLYNGINKIQVLLFRRDFGEPLALEYHRFHRYLLEVICEKISHEALLEVAARFRNYEELRRSGVLLREDSLGAKPRTLYVSPNTECGLHCKMCDVGMDNIQASLHRNLKTESPNVLDGNLLVRRIHEANIARVHFIGTEPLLYKEIFEVLKKLNQMGVETVLTTNGINLPQSAERLAQDPPGTLWISVDGPPLVHDMIRGLNGLFQRISDGVIALKRASEKLGRGLPKLYLSCAISNLNQNSLVVLMEAVNAWPVEAVTFTHLNYITSDVALRHNTRYPEWPVGASSINEHVAPWKIDPWRLYCEIEAVKSRWPDRAFFVPDTDFPGIVDLYLHPERQVGRTSCSIPWECMEVGANGAVVSMARCFGRTLGNIKAASLDEIWRGKEFDLLRDFIKKHGLQPPCYRCCGVL